MFSTYLRGDLGETALAGDTNVLMWFLILLSAAIGVKAIAAALYTLFLGRFSENSGYVLRKNFMKYLLHIPFSKLEKTSSGENLSVLSNDIPRAAQLLGSSTIEVVNGFIYFLAAVVFMFIISPILTIITLALIPFLVMLQVVCSKPIQKNSITMSEKEAGFNAIVNDSLQNVSTIAAYGLEQIMEGRYLQIYDDFLKNSIKFIKSLIILVFIGFLASLIPIIVISIIASFWVINGTMSIAEFIAFVAISNLIMEWLAMLSQNLGQFQIAISGAKRLNNNMAETIEELKAETNQNIADVSISFKNISFAYSEEAGLALNNVSFDIQPGSKVAFVGESGSGKSTVLKLLLGLYEPTNGEIVINDKSSIDISKSSIRNFFAYVPQDSFLFPESIGKNITLSKDITNKVKLEKACADAGILDFISLLPDSFEGVLSEASENISGGQRQRLALARAFYKDAPIILFDEATSALDPETESGIMHNLKTYAKNKTIIMVAHRIKAINFCDSIVVMDGGKVSDIGSHDELLAKNNIYRKLYKSQNKEEVMQVE